LVQRIEKFVVLALLADQAKQGMFGMQLEFRFGNILQGKGSFWLKWFGETYSNLLRVFTRTFFVKVL
jgi:hypothetical protein